MGSEARARLGLWALLIAALFAYQQVVASSDYRGPAILGLLLASGLSILTRRMGWGSIIGGIAGLGGLAWYLAIVFQARHTLYGLPTPEALSRVVRSVVRAHGHSITDYAPVPLRPGYAVMLVAALWVATSIGESATFRWRRPVAASLLPIVLFAVALVVGSGAGGPVYVVLFLVALLTYWALESAHRLRSWGRWVGSWKHQPDSDGAPVTGPLARRLGASAVMAAIVAPVFLPALGDGLLSWRSGLGEGIGSGGNGGGSVNPWVSIEPRLVEQSDELFFEIDAPRAAYWRVASLEEFDGSRWHEASPDRAIADDGVVPGSAVPGASTSQLTQEITVLGLRGAALPAALSPSQVRRLDAEGEEATDGLVYDPDSGSVFVSGGLQEGDRFEVLSVTPRASFEELNDAAPGAVLSRESVYLETPGLTRGIQNLVQRWTRNSTTPFEKLVAIQEELRAFNYELNPAQLEQENYLEDFLLRTREGYCQQFATSFAIMARSLGFPTRVSVGFLPGAQDTIGSRFVVSGTDAHAWPEVNFEGFGWIPFEPTPRVGGSSSTLVPGYTNEPSEANGPERSVVGLTENALLGNEFDTRGPGGTGPPRGLGGLTDGRQVIVTPSETAAQRSEARRAEWRRTFTRVTGWGLVAILLIVLAIPLAKELRHRRRYSRATEPNKLAAAAYKQFQEDASELAEPRLRSESARAYAARMERLERVAGTSANRLAQIYEASEFSPAPVTAEQATEAKRLAKRLRSQLWSQASWWERAVRLFSPRRLRPL
jgi:transglutaminase-like putative cysteine protease